MIIFVTFTIYCQITSKKILLVCNSTRNEWGYLFFYNSTLSFIASFFFANLMSVNFLLRIVLSFIFLVILNSWTFFQVIIYMSSFENLPIHILWSVICCGPGNHHSYLECIPNLWGNITKDTNHPLRLLTDTKWIYH